MTIAKRDGEQAAALHWVAKAADFSGRHLWARGVWVETHSQHWARVVATDGLRMHSALISHDFLTRHDLFHPGCTLSVHWRTKTSTTFDGLEPRDFPAWRAVVPECRLTLELGGYTRSEFLVAQSYMALADSGAKVPYFNPVHVEAAALSGALPTHLGHDDDPDRAVKFWHHGDPLERWTLVQPLDRAKATR